jgi:hypothetical protein
MWGYGLDQDGSGYGQVVGTCEWGNGPSDSIIFSEFLGWMKTCYLFKKDSAPRSKFSYNEI